MLCLISFPPDAKGRVRTGTTPSAICRAEVCTPNWDHSSPDHTSFVQGSSSGDTATFNFSPQDPFHLLNYLIGLSQQLGYYNHKDNGSIRDCIVLTEILRTLTEILRTIFVIKKIVRTTGNLIFDRNITTGVSPIERKQINASLLQDNGHF